ncbi:hypothetical protein L6452_42485 [Arctium lappa]|uniref:Uncharacterized protein n=1 Tax=Arctium lappa TaxID=4217 RepID=A0ACB8XJ64_ARCLA|nr:hypothetical protein L6452_42485 [Arctium lappa]
MTFLITHEITNPVFGISEAKCYRPQMTMTYDMLGSSFVALPSYTMPWQSYVTPPAHVGQGPSLDILTSWVEEYLSPPIPSSMRSGVDTIQAQLTTPMGPCGSNIIADHFSNVDVTEDDSMEVVVQAAEVAAQTRGK